MLDRFKKLTFKKRYHVGAHRVDVTKDPHWRPSRGPFGDGWSWTLGVNVGGTVVRVRLHSVEVLFVANSPI
jgi:hypothetical protein